MIGVLLTIFFTFQMIVLCDWVTISKKYPKTTRKIVMPYSKAKHNALIKESCQKHKMYENISYISFSGKKYYYYIFFTTIFGYFRYWFEGLIINISVIIDEKRTKFIEKRANKVSRRRKQIQMILEYENEVRGIDND